MSETKLKPCNVGHRYAKHNVVVLKSNKTGLFYVCCTVCNDCTKEFETVQEAIEAWNRRAQNDKAEV